jgi:hypothetical protein
MPSYRAFKFYNMTTSELIQLLQRVEKGASGRSRNISIYTKNKNGSLKKAVLKEENFLEIVSTGDGVAGAQLALVINAR